MCYNRGMKLVLFCDYGLDDAVATYDALKRGGYEGYDLVAIGGNVPKEVALCNAQKLLANLDFPLPRNVRVVDTTAEAQPAEFLKSIHGGDGMGDLYEGRGAVAPVLPFQEWLCSLEGEFDLLSLGPTTLVERLLQEKTPRKFVLMGGNIAEEPNFHGYEFNHALDRVAFSACARYPHVAVTMDTCRNPLLNVQPKGIEGEGMMRDMVRRSRELTFGSGEKGCYIWDDMAVKYLRHPEWFTVEKRVDCDGNEVSVAKYLHGEPYSEIIEK